MAIVKVALRQREQLATLRVREGVLVLNTMLWPDEIRTPDFGFLDEDLKVRPPELAMASSLIDSMAGEFEPDVFTDDYRAALQEVIDAKVEGREVVQPEEVEEAPAAAVDLMAALKASVERAKAARGEQPARGGGGGGEPTPDLVGPVGAEGSREEGGQGAREEDRGEEDGREEGGRSRRRRPPRRRPPRRRRSRRRRPPHARPHPARAPDRTAAAAVSAWPGTLRRPLATGGAPMPYTPDLDRLLTPGARFTDQHGGYLIEVHPVGDVVLPTGRVVGVRPAGLPGGGAVHGHGAARAVPRSRLGRGGAPGGRRGGPAGGRPQLVVSDEPTIRWELAVAGDQDVATLGATTASATGWTPASAPWPTRPRCAVLEGWDYDRVEEVFIADKLPSSPVPGLITAVLDEASGANVVTVATGWGDGCYGTWIGRAADGRVTSFVTDFMVVPE